MVPILEIKKGNLMPESLDIVSYVDKQNGQPIVSWKTNKKLSAWLNKNSSLCYELAMPRWVQAPLDEFKTKKGFFKRKKKPTLALLKTAGAGLRHSLRK